MNVFVRFYIDWTIQILYTTAFFVMVLTSALYFVGMSVYITGMLADLRAALAEFANVSTNTRSVIESILLHQRMLK